jgi:hypothetical protein
MSTKEFIDLYIQCYPGVKNEMMMRTNADDLNGRFVYDDQVVDGALHAMAWVIFTRETPMLHFPEAYGRKVTVTLYDIWNNVRAVYNKAGDYLLDIPGCSAGVAMASIACSDGSDEQEYQMAFDVMQDLSIEDIGVGGSANDYEDFLTLVPAASTLNVEEPFEISGKEFFAIANAVYKYNPFPEKVRTGYRTELLKRTMSMTAPDLDVIKAKAMAKMGR